MSRIDNIKELNESEIYEILIEKSKELKTLVSGDYSCISYRKLPSNLLLSSLDQLELGVIYCSTDDGGINLYNTYGASYNYYLRGSLVVYSEIIGEGDYKGFATGETFRVTQDAAFGNNPSKFQYNFTKSSGRSGSSLTEGAFKGFVALSDIIEFINQQ